MRIWFFIIAMSILILLNVYVIQRVWQCLQYIPAVRPYAVILLLFMFVCFVSGMIAGAYLPHNTGKIICHLGNTYFILSVYLIISFIAVDVVRILHHYIASNPSDILPYRFGALVVTLLISAVACIYGLYRFNHPAIVELQLQTDHPTQNKLVRIVAASDIHLGVTIDKEYLKRYVELINKQKPDIVLLAGDVTDRSIVPVEKQNMLEDLKRIKAPLGVYAINGNHEHFSERPNATADYLTKAGIKVLIDQRIEVDSSFYLIGRDDRVNPNRKKLSELVEGLNPDKPRILLDHQPYELNNSVANGIDLQISGHTHEGQFFPANLIVGKMYELAHGYLKKGKTHFYVSSGLGIWGPQYRIGTQSELVVITLKY